jgi:SOS-response transcriptional repressor LexA
MTTFAANRLSPSMLRVLAAVLDLHQRGPVTVQAIRNRLGARSNNYIHQCLCALSAQKLVGYEWGKRATIRPTCQVELFPAAMREEATAS